MQVEKSTHRQITFKRIETKQEKTERKRLKQQIAMRELSKRTVQFCKCLR